MQRETGGHRCARPAGSIPVEAEFPTRLQNPLPVRFAFDNHGVGNTGGMALQKRKPEVLPAIVQTAVLEQFLQVGIVAMSGRAVFPPTRPDAPIAVSSPYIQPPRSRVGNQINALCVLQSTAPIGPVVADQRFQFAETDVDSAMTRKIDPGILLPQNFADCKLV